MRYAALFFVWLATTPLSFAQPSIPPTEPYKDAVAALEALAKREVEDKKLPALSIALVDDQSVVWAAGFGFQDRDRKTPATAETVYRVGSVSKLFTDVAIMQLVEEGKLDLDEPVAKYVPDFKPLYKEGQKPITLRMLMAHHSGLIREAPVGNYFDPTEPSLEKSIASLNGIPLIYDSGARLKYSNAAIGLVGLTLQKTQKEKYEECVQRRVLDQLGMKRSSFMPTAEVKKRLASAVMWTYHGREFAAPTFELGTPPAGCMYSTVLDLARFQHCLFAGGKVGDRQILKPETIEKMFTPQFTKEKRGFGLGFSISEFEGKKRLGHGGAISGFATSFTMLPAEKLGVIVVASRDVSNAVTDRIATAALRQMLAVKAGKPLPKIETTEPLSAEEARKLAGRYRGIGGGGAADRWIDLVESFGNLYLVTDTGRERSRLRKLGDKLITDDVHDWGLQLAREGDEITLSTTTYKKEKPPATPPPEPPAKWKGLIGEYGHDHLPLYIYERDGKLCALIELTEINVLAEESEDVYAFPASGCMYHGEKLVFTRDKTGRATKVVAASVTFERRKIDGEGGETFKIKPVKPIDEIRKAALAAKPPEEKGEFRKVDLVDLATIDGIKFDIRYATDNNFLSTPFYTSAKAFMQKPAAEALKRVNEKLKPLGYGLIVFDSYRPWHVTKMFWDATPEKFHNFVADPSKGSRHNRGCAVDLGLCDLKTGKVIEMVAGFDEFADRAFPDYPGGTSRQRCHRDLLRRAMEEHGFAVYEEEWWHYDYKDWKQYPILNKTFEELK
jgi:CubicO group peptidase (beta-lactamase class C family)/D-alanyl-D-alanine dipeptidase